MRYASRITAKTFPGGLAAAALVALATGGCGRGNGDFSPVPATTELAAPARAAVSAWVADHFGTPAAPAIEPALPVDFGVAEQGGEGENDLSATLLRGRAFYLSQCVQCHGPDGAGDGATASALNPRPRDFRLGIFKYTSTGPTAKARRDDLKRTLRAGLPGTAMPRYAAVPDEDLDAVIEYVRWLAMRGEAETAVSLELAFEEFSTEGAEKAARESAEAIGRRALARVGEAWAEAEVSDAVVRANIPRPPATPASIATGGALFRSEEASCASCHGPNGRGDGPEVDLPHHVPGAPAGVREPGLWDAWGRRVRPRDLTRGSYRGGGDPVDLFRRLKVGVKGTPMPGAGGKLTDEEIWHLVNYVVSLAD